MSREKMPLSDRARQFLPFDALKGLQDALRLKEYEHERIEKGDLSIDMIDKISNTLFDLKNNDIVNLEYYSDGRYINIQGKAKLNIISKIIIINDLKISFDNIHNIEIIDQK